MAEILPIESADMYYFLDPTPAGNIYHLTVQRVDVGIKNLPQYDKGDIPCWSLAALLELLPKRIEIVDNVYELSIYLYGIYYWNINNGNLCFKSKDKDSLVDACYEAIVFLHEQKLL